MARLKFVSRTGNIVSSGAGAVIYERYTAQAGQTVIRMQSPYVVGVHQLNVHRNGVLQEVNVHYEETDSNTVTFLNPLIKGDSILLTIQGVYSERMHEEYVAGEAQAVFPLNGAYHVGLMTLQVFRNGMLQRLGVDYAETDNHTVTLTAPCTSGEILIFHEVV